MGIADVTIGPSDSAAAAVCLAPGPDGSQVYVATRGRGIWETAMP
jgi:hypothetical protein